ncbi:MAG: SAM-dependent chlorinase/fluorinase [Armatimonadetes bacterium]|nr:SAM-dependent chlorinase/fluorinase [Armatimonadota bacterium]MDE2205042.1 SAM-dependent chlorinase/fluorinase [Armatimonadota bacterium]
MTHPAVITLTTDFGLADPFVGVMKGAILRCATAARIVDITHAIPPQDVMAASWLLSSSVGWFPHGTVHVAVVDPGVGSARHALAIRCGTFFLVGPDNGIFTETLLQYPQLEAVVIEPEAIPVPAMSATFHGRDLFALAAAEIALGRPIRELGLSVSAADLVRLALPQRHATENAVAGFIRWIDRFGNLISDIVPELLDAALSRSGSGPLPAPRGPWLVTVGSCTVRGIRRTYTDVDTLEPIALFGSSGTLEVAVRNGSAAELAGIGIGEPIRLCRNLV